MTMTRRESFGLIPSLLMPVGGPANIKAWNEMVLPFLNHAIEQRMKFAKPSVKSTAHNFSPLTELIAARDAIKLEHEGKEHDNVKRPFKFYPEPKTTFDAFMFYSDHKAKFLHNFDCLAGWDNVTVIIGAYYVTFHHDCTKQRELEDYFANYMLPAAVALHKSIYSSDPPPVTKQYS